LATGVSNLFQSKLRTFVPVFTLNVARIYLSDGLFSSTASISRLAYPVAYPTAHTSGSGILTGFPSITPFGLILGSTNPAQINLTQETLGFRCACFLHTLSLLMPTESFLITPTFLTDMLYSYRMLAYHVNTFKASVYSLSPVTLSVQDYLTSELLRFL
jgi:hypothetical protein